MDILGIHVRTSGGRYLAGFALLDDATVVDSWSHPSPAGDATARLADLYRFTADLLEQHPVDAVSIKGSEAGSSKALTEATHAEGAILAAAGTSSVKSKVWTGPGYRGAIGAKNNPDVLVKSRSELSGAWPSENEARQAAAAGLAAVRKPF